MKKLILSELLLLFLATTFMTDSPPPGWYQQTLPRSDVTIQDLYFLDSLNGYVVTRKTALDSAFIYKTTDGGNSWITSLMENIYLTSIQFVDNNTGYSVGSAPPGIVKKTTNSGVSWFTSAIGFGYPLRDLAFVNKDTGWTCSDDNLGGGIYKTVNGGINWTLQLGSSYTPSRLFFLNNDTGWAVCNGNKLFRTTNSGGNWGEIHNFTSTITNFFFASRDTGYLVGGLSSGPNLLKTTDGGFFWDTVHNSIQFGGGQKIFMLNNARGWIGSIFNTIVASKDGNNWGTQYSPSFTSFSIHFVDSLKGWAGTSILVHTADGGGSINAIQQISNEVPSNFNLYQNYPNPFNPKTKIKFLIASNIKGETAKVKIIVYDIIGRQIAALVDTDLKAGEYETEFDGSGYSSGIYFYSLIVDGNIIDTKKMILIK